MFALFGTILLVFFLYVRPQEFIEVLQAIPLLYLFLAAALFGLVLDLRLRIVRANLSPLFGWWIAFILWGALTVSIKAPERAITVLSGFMVPMALFLVVSQSVQTFKALHVMAGVVLSICLFLTFVGIHQGFADTGCVILDPKGVGQYGVMQPDGRACDTRESCEGFGSEPGAEYACEKIGLFGTNAVSGRVRYRGILQDPNELALAIGTAMAFAFAFYMRKRTMPRLYFLGLAIAAIGLCVILTKSRGGLLVFMACLGVFGLRKFGAKFAAVGLVLAGPMMLLSGRGEQEASQSSMERMEAWMTGLEFFKRDPILGVGLGQFNEHHWLTAHNSYLLVASETGILGFFLWSTILYICVKILWTALRRYNGVPDARIASVWALALLATFGSMMVGVLFLSLSYHPILWLYFGLCAGFWHAVKSHDPSFDVRMGMFDYLAILAADVTFLFLLAAYLRLKGEA